MDSIRRKTSIASLGRYRRALTEFVRGLPVALSRTGPDLEAVEGGGA